MKISKLATLALLTLLTPAAWAEGTMTIQEAIAFATPPTAMTGGAFMQITNTGTTDDVLLNVQADFPRVELHTTEFNDGIASMMHLDSIPIPAGETVTFEPGGLHVMFMGLRGDPLEVGETIDATLTFEVAGVVAVTFNVVEREMTHSH